jgi:hypothetical protein
MVASWTWIKLRLGRLVCLAQGHVPSRRRGHFADDGTYTTVCRRCEIRMVRDNGKIHPAHKPKA